MEDKELKKTIEMGVQLAETDAALKLGMKIWKVRGLETPEPQSAEFQEMMEAGRKLMDRFDDEGSSI